MSIHTIRDALRSGGLPAALQVLNDRVPHRFTAVYQLDGDFMRNVAIVDKSGEVVRDDLLSVPFTSSFCQFVLRDGFFKLMGDHDDARLEGHPYKGILQSYVGVPLSRDGTDLIGTFCHFDFPPLRVPDDEFVFMQQVAREMPPYISRSGSRSGAGAESVVPHLGNKN
ncbi:MAG: GAF domain-containing protein [Ramlibacter sp.]|nr:GAF domain-containing protein [Ramlibacter sp.]